MKDENGKIENELQIQPGLNLGIGVDIPFCSHVGMQTGVQLDTRGTRISEKVQGDKYIGVLNLLYVTVPVLAKGTWEINEDKRLYGLFGPYFGVGVVGQFKDKWIIDGERDKEAEETTWGKPGSNNDFRRFSRMRNVDAWQ